MDMVYDEHLSEIPDDLFSAVKKAELARIEILTKLFAERLTALEEKRFKASDPQLLTCLEQVIRQVNKKKE